MWSTQAREHKAGCYFAQVNEFLSFTLNFLTRFHESNVLSFLSKLQVLRPNSNLLPVQFYLLIARHSYIILAV